MKQIIVQFTQSVRARSERGQSLVELALFLPVLLIILVGVFEMGFFINHYINMIDATREAARYAADLDPVANYRPEYNHNSASYNAGFVYYCEDPDGGPPGGGPLEGTTEFYTVVACYAEQSMPEQFNPSNGYDDIVISAFTVENGAVVYRWPYDAAEMGFSYLGHQVSRFSNAELSDLVSGYAPRQGFVLVEIFWQHRQALALPVFTFFVPERIPIHVYTLMPNPTAGTVE